VTADASGVGAETVTVEGGESVDFELQESLDVGLVKDSPRRSKPVTTSRSSSRSRTSTS